MLEASFSVDALRDDGAPHVPFDDDYGGNGALDMTRLDDTTYELTQLAREEALTITGAYGAKTGHTKPATAHPSKLTNEFTEPETSTTPDAQGPGGQAFHLFPPWRSARGAHHSQPPPALAADTFIRRSTG